MEHIELLTARAQNTSSLEQIGILFLLIGLVAVILWWYKRKKRLNNSISAQTTERFEQSEQGEDIFTKIVGVTKENDSGIEIQKLLPNMRNGQQLLLVREHSNQYDSNAIKVYCNRQHIGYISRDLAHNLAPYMDRGNAIKAAVSEVTGGTGGKCYGCNIKITLY